MSGWQRGGALGRRWCSVTSCCGPEEVIAIARMETRWSGGGATPFYMAGEAGRRPTAMGNNFIDYKAVTGEEESRQRYVGGGIQGGGLALRFCFSDSTESSARQCIGQRCVGSGRSTGRNQRREKGLGGLAGPAW
jgi:hypothetical protein